MTEPSGIVLGPCARKRPVEHYTGWLPRQLLLMWLFLIRFDLIHSFEFSTHVKTRAVDVVLFCWILQRMESALQHTHICFVLHARIHPRKHHLCVFIFLFHSERYAHRPLFACSIESKLWFFYCLHLLIAGPTTESASSPFSFVHISWPSLARFRGLRVVTALARLP